MKSIKYIVILFLITFSQVKAQSFAIQTNSNGIVYFCHDPVLFAENLTVQSSTSISAMKVSISEGYVPSEDFLAYSASSGTITAVWNAATGYLILTGSGSTNAADYEAALRQVPTYSVNSNPNPTVGLRNFSLAWMMLITSRLPAIFTGTSQNMA